MNIKVIFASALNRYYCMNIKALVIY